MESDIQELEENRLFQYAMGHDLYLEQPTVQKAEMKQFADGTEGFKIQQHFFKY